MSIDPNRPTFETICQRWEQEWPVRRWSGHVMILAVSGGPDSVLLLRVIHALIQRNAMSPSQIQVAHFNHQLRENAMGDAQFVQNLAQWAGFDFHGGEGRTDAADEASLRDQRYAFLQKVADNTGARYVLLGHNQDDQVETVLFRMARGTGISGLKGIPKVRKLNHGVTVVRPLLSTSRSEIEDALQELGQLSRMDESNSESVYKRNFLRNEIVPKLRGVFPGLDKSLVRLAKHADRVADFLNVAAVPLMDAFQFHSCELQIESGILLHHHPALVSHALVNSWTDANWPKQGMNQSHWNHLVELILSDDATATVHNLPLDFRARKKDGKVVVTRPSN